MRAGSANPSEIEVLDAGHLVGQFGDAQLVINRGLESMAAAHNAAVLALPHHVTLVRVNLIHIDAGPRIAHRRGHSGTTVNLHDHRVLLPRLKAGGLDQSSVEFAAVRSLESDDLGGPYVVLVGLRAVGLAIDAQFLAVAGVQRGAAGRTQIGIRVQVKGAGGAHRHGVGEVGARSTDACPNHPASCV